MTKKNKTGQITLNMLPSIFVTLGIAVIVVAVGALLLQEVQDTEKPSNLTGQYNTSIAYNITVKGGEGLVQASNFFPILGLVIIATVVIGILYMLRT